MKIQALINDAYGITETKPNKLKTGDRREQNSWHRFQHCPLLQSLSFMSGDVM